jgi:hypothetical protein
MAVSAALRRLGAVFLTWLPVAGRDVLGVAGLGSIAYGCWMLSPPAGFIAGGLEAAAICALLTLSDRR